MRGDLPEYRCLVSEVAASTGDYTRLVIELITVENEYSYWNIMYNKMILNFLIEK